MFYRNFCLRMIVSTHWNAMEKLLLNRCLLLWAVRGICTHTTAAHTESHTVTHSRYIKSMLKCVCVPFVHLYACTCVCIKYSDDAGISSVLASIVVSLFRSIAAWRTLSQLLSCGVLVCIGGVYIRWVFFLWHFNLSYEELISNFVEFQYEHNSFCSPHVSNEREKKIHISNDFFLFRDISMNFSVDMALF